MPPLTGYPGTPPFQADDELQRMLAQLGRPQNPFSLPQLGGPSASGAAGTLGNRDDPLDQIRILIQQMEQQQNQGGPLQQLLGKIPGVGQFLGNPAFGQIAQLALGAAKPGLAPGLAAGQQQQQQRRRQSQDTLAQLRGQLASLESRREERKENLGLQQQQLDLERQRTESRLETEGQNRRLAAEEAELRKQAGRVAAKALKTDAGTDLSTLMESLGENPFAIQLMSDVLRIRDAAGDLSPRQKRAGEVLVAKARARVAKGEDVTRESLLAELPESLRGDVTDAGLELALAQAQTDLIARGKEKEAEALNRAVANAQIGSAQASAEANRARAEQTRVETGLLEQGAGAAPEKDSVSSAEKRRLLENVFGLSQGLADVQSNTAGGAARELVLEEILANPGALRVLNEFKAMSEEEQKRVLESLASRPDNPAVQARRRFLMNYLLGLTNAAQ